MALNIEVLYTDHLTDPAYTWWDLAVHCIASSHCLKGSSLSLGQLHGISLGGTYYFPWQKVHNIWGLKSDRVSLMLMTKVLCKELLVCRHTTQDIISEQEGMLIFLSNQIKQKTEAIFVVVVVFHNRVE